MADLADYIYRRVNSTLDMISPDERAEVYVVSLFVYDEDDDPRRPTVTVGFNTESDVAGATGHSDDSEARWNYAFYRQNELAVIFDTDGDPEGSAVRQKVIEDAGYSFAGDDELASGITTPWFVANTVFAARRLHDTGDVVRVFGRSIPVLVHELEYSDVIAMQNLAANPPTVADEFIHWCRNLQLPRRGIGFAARGVMS